MEEDMEDSYEIEEVRKRRVKEGVTEYRIKWLGYSDEENTWQNREDLVADGFEAVVDEYDAMLEKDSTARKESHGRRVRSKTPQRKPLANALTPNTTTIFDTAKESGEDEDEDEEEEESKEPEEHVASNAQAPQAPQAPPARRPMAGQTEQGAFMTMFVVMFLGATVASVVLRSIRAHLDDSGGSSGAPPIDAWTLNLVTLVVFPLPMFLCLRAVLLFAVSTDFSNRASAMIVWAGMAKFCEALRHFEEADLSSQSGLFATGMWLVLCLLTLHSSSASPSGAAPNGEGDESSAEIKRKKHTNEVAALGNWVSLTMYFVVAGFMFQLDRHPRFAHHRLALHERLLVALALFIFARAASRLSVSLVMDKATAAHLWVELLGVVCAVIFVALQLLELNPKYRHMLPNVDPYIVNNLPNLPKAQLHIPLFKIAHDFILFAHSFAFTCSTMMPHA